MDDLLMTLETEIALLTKHLQEDEDRKTDKILGQFFKGRATVEAQQLKVLRKLSDMANKL